MLKLFISVLLMPIVIKLKPKKITISADELNRGKRLEYTSEPIGQPSPLRLSAVLPPGLSWTMGWNGTFQNAAFN